MKLNMIYQIKKNSFLERIFRFITKLSSKNSTNCFVLIKKNGKKIYNPKIKNLTVNFNGVNNYLEIKEPYHFIEKIEITFMKDNAKMTINGNSKIKKLEASLDKNSSITIGSYFGANNAFITTNGGINTAIKIGNSCMLASDITIRSSDAHVIYDIETKETINSSQDVTIGNHVWICSKSTILKGAKIPENTIVALGSIVTKQFNENNCIIAGSPARIIKKGVNWDHRKESEWEELQNH